MKVGIIFCEENILVKNSLSFVIAVGFLLTLTSFAQNPLNPAKTTKYLIKKWSTEDGLPQNSVTAIVQSADGYLWLGTFGGLARFDGIKFTIFDTANSPGLTNNRITALYEDVWGRLWVGSENGETFVFADGIFSELKSVTNIRREIVLGFQQDSQGNLYIASRGGLERFAFDDKGNINQAGTGLLSGENTIFKDTEGRIWVNLGNEFFIVENDKLISAEEKGFKIPAGTEKIRFTEDQRIYAGGTRAFGVLTKENYRKILTTQEIISRNYFDIACKKGTCWFQEKNYLLEWNGSESTRYDLSQYVDGGSRVIFIDKEDNLWLGTSKDGLVRFTRRNISLVSDLAQNRIKSTYSVIEDAKGRIWIAGIGLLKIENNRVNFYHKNNLNQTPVTFRSLAVDAADNLWIGDDWGVNVFRDEKFVGIPQFQNQKIDALFFDKEQTLWGGGSQGLYRLKNAELRHFTTADGLVHNKVTFITQLSDGKIYVGTVGGISVLENEKFVNYTTAHGLSSNHIRDLFQEGDGTIWVGTYGGGINRWRNGAFTAITKEKGLHDNFVSRILADDSGSFWMLGNRGVFLVSRDELNEVAEGRREKIFSAVYGTGEEIKYSEGSGGHQPAGWRSQTGQIYFPMIEDMVIIDPDNRRGVALRAIIERAASKTGGSESQTISQLNGTSVIKIEDGVRNLEIEYTGLSFVKPEMIRFFYKLDGLDKDWIDAGTRRTAFYPYLPSGEYVFQVKAVTIDGIWSESPATVKIIVAKSFWQTGWFIGMVLLLALLGLFLIYWLRLRQLNNKQLKQQEFTNLLLNAHESERQRIANELHDGLGQNLLIIKNWALHGLDNLKSREEIRKDLEKISITAADSLEETRAIVGNLSPQNLKRFGLTEAIVNMIEQIEDSTGVLFITKIENIDGVFNDETEISIFRIIQECLNNIVKHSESPRGEVLLARVNDDIEITIKDFGKGFLPSRQAGAKNNKNGFGLQNITQRINLLGGNLDLASVRGEGTVIRIRIKI